MQKKSKNHIPLSEIRCIFCRKEFSMAVGQTSFECPNCGTTVLPVDINDDVEIKINWYELKLLCLWSERWANHIDTSEKSYTGGDGKISNLLFSIVKPLQEQFPSFDALTMSGEMSLIERERGSKVSLPFIMRKGPAPPIQH